MYTTITQLQSAEQIMFCDKSCKKKDWRQSVIHLRPVYNELQEIVTVTIKIVTYLFLTPTFI